MAFGANLAHWRTNQCAHIRDSGTFTFNGTATGLGMADFLTGRLTTMSHGSQGAWGTRQTTLQCMLADVWKVTPRLTLNYGVRWEPFLPLKQRFGHSLRVR